MQKIIECVPNFSEGRDLEIVRQITAAIESIRTEPTSRLGDPSENAGRGGSGPVPCLSWS